MNKKYPLYPPRGEAEEEVFLIFLGMTRRLRTA